MFRFSIRDVLWLTIVVALAIAWWVERTRALKQIEQLTVSLAAAETRLAEAEDLLEFEGVVMKDGSTIHTTPEHAAELRKLDRAQDPLRR
jgi:hypothetical protein